MSCSITTYIRVAILDKSYFCIIWTQPLMSIICTCIAVKSISEDSNHTDSSVFYTEIGTSKIRNAEINQ